MDGIMRFRHNVMNIDSFSAFKSIRGGVNQDCRDVSFVRFVGVNEKIQSDIQKMDADLQEQMRQGQIGYRRTAHLPGIGSGESVKRYVERYFAWVESGRKSISPDVLSGDKEYERALGNAVLKVTEVYFSGKQMTESMEKNFVVKLLFWHDFLMNGVALNWNERVSVKLVLANIVKRQEYLFCYLLTLLGYDVLLLQCEADISAEDAKLGYSRKIELGNFGQIDFKAMETGNKAVPESIATEKPESAAESVAARPVKVTKPVTAAKPVTATKPVTTAKPVTATKPVTAAKPVKVTKPVTTAKPVTATKPISAVNPVKATKPITAVKPVTATKPVSAVKPERVTKPITATKPVTAAKPVMATKSAGSRVEKSFEELALLASSVVLIAIHGHNGDVIGTGSGIMVGANGYILTNCHVASGGKYYSVRIEEDETVYTTDELIKYNSVLDLAVLRIDRRLEPLTLYRGKQKLVRGQKVVAIGSPLGLFNSVSDGIVSGFRRIDDVDMIQFTAPTSHGSSGGAVLNMFGEVIGISTAGFDNAQNINLAVGYESIEPFIRGFT